MNKNEILKKVNDTALQKNLLPAIELNARDLPIKSIEYKGCRDVNKSDNYILTDVAFNVTGYLKVKPSQIDHLIPDHLFNLMLSNTMHIGVKLTVTLQVPYLMSPETEHIPTFKSSFFTSQMGIKINAVGDVLNALSIFEAGLDNEGELIVELDDIINNASDELLPIISLYIRDALFIKPHTLK